MSMVALSRPVAFLPWRSRYTPTPPSARARRKSRPPQSATMKPMPSQAGWSIWSGRSSQCCRLVEPLPGESHQDQTGEADEQEREVAEPQQPGLAAREEDRGRACEQRAEDDGRADEVQEQREALLVGPDRGEHLRHRASRSCRSRSARSRPTRGRGAEARSGYGSRRSALRSGRSGRRRRALVPSRPVSRTRRRSATAPPRRRSHRTIAAITQPSHTWKASRRIASQIPKRDRADQAHHRRHRPHHPDPVRLSVAPGVCAESERDHDDPRHHQRAHERRRASAGAARRSSPRSS